MSGSDRELLLRKFDLWSSLSHEEYKELQVLDNYKEFRRDEFIYFEAFQHNQIYFIKNGHIKIGQLDERGNRIITDILKPGDFFGQVGLDRQNLHGEFAQCIKSDISLCSFTVDHFTNLLFKKPQMAIKYSKLAGIRLKRFENRLINILQKDVRTRILLFLEQLLREHPHPKGDLQNGMTIPNYLTHDELAQLTGTSRQTATTLLNSLKEEGILEFSRKEIRFKNLGDKFRWLTGDLSGSFR